MLMQKLWMLKVHQCSGATGWVCGEGTHGAVYRTMSFGLEKARGGLELGKRFGKYLNMFGCYVPS